MICPAKGLLAAVNRSGFDVRPLAWPLALFTFQAMSPKFTRHHSPPHRIFEAGPAYNRGARPGCPFAVRRPVALVAAAGFLCLTHPPIQCAMPPCDGHAKLQRPVRGP